MPSQSSGDIIFRVTLPASQDPVVIVTARDREEAKRLAWPALRHDRERYIVEPLTQRGADVRFITRPAFGARHAA